MNDDFSPRLTAMRDAMVAEVDRSGTPGTAPVPRRRPTRGTVLAVLAAFVVGGGLTGGLTAAALPGADPDAAVETQLATSARYQVEESNHATVLGTPTFLVTHGDRIITLDDRPRGADAITVSWTCLDRADLRVAVDGTRVDVGDPCLPSTEDVDRTSWSMTPVDGPGNSTVTLSGSGPARYAVWVSWVQRATIAEPSPQQDAETADGVVTLQEYTTAFNRLQACMAQAGHPMGEVPLTYFADGLWSSTPGGDGPWYQYGIASESVEAFDTQCYPREFDDVDTIWQGEHPMPYEPPVDPALRD